MRLRGIHLRDWSLLRRKNSNGGFDADAKLTKDFEYLVKKTGWLPGKLLHLLYWDANMMHADAQTVVRKARDRAWPIDRKRVEAILKNVARLSEQLELIEKTEFSPARKVILRNSEGSRLSPKDESFLLKAFGVLPNILRSYRGELKRNFNITSVFWEREKQRWKYLVDHARRNSLYEEIRLANPANTYNANRLLRLVNVSRDVQKLPQLAHRAFVVWLNKLKKRSSTPPMASPFQPSQPLTTSEPRELIV